MKRKSFLVQGHQVGGNKERMKTNASLVDQKEISFD